MIVDRLLYARALGGGGFIIQTLAQARRLVIEQDTPLFYEEYAPHPFADTALFLGSTALQIAWLLPLFVRPGADQQDDEDEEKSVGLPADEITLVDNLHELGAPPPIEPDAAQLAYLPTYAVCSLLTALWTPFFLEQNYIVCEAILTLAVFIHLYSLFTPFLHTPVLRSRKHILTHLVAKSSTGLAILYMWKTWGALGGTGAPTTSTQGISAMIFLTIALATGPDPLVPAALILDVPGEAWRSTFRCIAVLLGAVVVVEWILLGRPGLRWGAEEEVDKAREREEEDGYANEETVFDADEEMEAQKTSPRIRQGVPRRAD
ncbi:hypothetical protein BD626DRAFT_477414 [Schizophyllum amplum]|uniref:Uncharacterized protein n=1 Tax=Schizophyllum amplum TaxID=97359 RepID=A0A550D078_9AGAR|nr:hypothetical protein BD626DRAFT_477414 [Auriculariopsis ampla]